MKIRMNITIDVDEKKWANEFGLEPGKAGEDAKQHMPELVRWSIDNLSHVRDGLAAVTRFE
jgi:hypothetical protein